MNTSQYINPEVTILLHVDIQGILDNPCFGEMVESDEYVDGSYIGTYLQCECCGHKISSIQVTNPQGHACSDSVCGSWEVENHA